jgi:hypothetical protein
MLWQGRRESEKVEDERGSGGGGRLVAGGGIGTVILVVVYLLLGGNPQALFHSQQQTPLSQPGQIDSQTPRDEASKFVAVVLAIPKTPGMIFSGKWGDSMRIQSSCSSRTRLGQAAGSPVAQPVRSIARKIDEFTSTSVFIVYCNNAWVQEAISQRPTS